MLDLQASPHSKRSKTDKNKSKRKSLTGIQKKTTLPAIAGDGSDVEEDKDILNVIISASDALRYAKGLKAYIQQQSKLK